MQNDLKSQAFSLPRAVWAVIRHPTRAFSNIAAYPSLSWLILAILLMLLVFLSSFLNQRLQMSQVTTPERVGSPSILLSMGGSLLVWLKWLVWVGLLYLGSTLFGGNSTFRTLWRVVLWASLPDLIRSLLQVGFLLLSSQPIEYGGLSGLILRGVEQPAGAQLALGGILTQIDLFAIWRLYLLATGIANTTGLGRRKSWIVVLIVWVLLAALSLIPAQISSFVNTSLS